ncbi:MAG TPA: DUF3891 family protein [Solirubrobacteraceae bacterium]|nr:DUF3891 family protein [Solirubrobacteraceae bacterium]
MIVCDLGDRWQIVMQTDHADLSGDFARRWKQRGDRADSLAIAAERHDDGWAVWEQAPSCDLDTGKPVNFLDVGVLSHLAFYRAGIAAVTEQDPYAGLLVSMHGAGIYRGRYGLQPELGLTQAKQAPEQVEAFVAEQESGFEARDAEVGVTAEQRRGDYELLQTYDRMSLLFCMNDTLSPSETEFGGYRFRPQGTGTMSIDPFPFEGEERFSLLRRVLPKTQWRTGTEFRKDLLGTQPERTSITVRAADAG